MFAFTFLAGDIGVTGLAGFVAGEGHGAGCGLSDGRTSVVSILAKAFGDDDRAQGDEGNQGDSHDSRKTDEVFDVLEQVVAPDAGRQLRKLRNALG